MHRDIEAIQEKIHTESAFVGRLLDEVGRVIVGQRYMIERLLIGLLADGHVLLEGVPGLAKTMTVRTLADAVHTTFRRIQFTPDLLPADLTGTLVYDPRQSEFKTHKGPIFANIILADEINRSPAKVQSALLEAMQERTVTIGDTTYPLDSPFLVLATQNPIEQEGTYPLPEAQVDRFMLKLHVDYLDPEEEMEVVERALGDVQAKVEPIVGKEDLEQARRVLQMIYVDEKIKRYVINLVTATRRPKESGLDDISPLIEYGASPRASIWLTMAARAQAFLKARGFVTPQDVKDVAHTVLRHRVILSYEAEAEELTSDDIIDRLLDHVPVP